MTLNVKLTSRDVDGNWLPDPDLTYPGAGAATTAWGHEGARTRTLGTGGLHAEAAVDDEFLDASAAALHARRARRAGLQAGARTGIAMHDGCDVDGLGRAFAGLHKGDVDGRLDVSTLRELRPRTLRILERAEQLVKQSTPATKAPAKRARELVESMGTEVAGSEAGSCVLKRIRVKAGLLRSSPILVVFSSFLLVFQDLRHRKVFATAGGLRNAVEDARRTQLESLRTSPSHSCLGWYPGGICGQAAGYWSRKMEHR